MKHYADNNKKNRGAYYARSSHYYEAKIADTKVIHEDKNPTKVYSAQKIDARNVNQKKVRTECPATPTAPAPPTKLGYAPAIVFAGFIFAMALWFVFGAKVDFSASEKRYLAEFPDTSAENILSGEFGRQFEEYFADHFPARNLWVGVSAYTSLAEGNNGANGVYHCKDDYLINKPVPAENNINKNLDILAEFKEIIGDVPMTAMFAPSTGYIVSDKLPNIHDTYNDDAYFATIADTLKQSGIEFVDLREPFKAAYAGGSQLYYRTDHHWTTEGAYTAYAEYCKSLGLEAVPPEKFQVEKYKGFYGTTYSTSGFWLTDPDTVEVWNNPDNTEDNITVKIYDTPTKTSNSMFFYEHDKEDDKYPIFLDGNHGWTEITNENAQGGTIIVIKDSFSHCFVPFLAEHYSKVIMVDMRYYNQEVSQMVAFEKPEQVLVLYGIDNFATDTDIVKLW